jgi:hypothetical protein
MGTDPQVDEFEDDVAPSRLPRPVEGGIEYVGGLGRFIDDLMGDSRTRRRVAEGLEPLLLREDETPPDTPASEAPPPVPGGIETMA